MSDPVVVPVPKQPLLTNRLYDGLKFVAQILLPALGTLYFALAGVWNLPYAEQVIGTITAVDVFLGVVLHVDTVKFQAAVAATPPVTDGVLNVSRAEGTIALNVGLDKLPEEIAAQPYVTFQVNDINPKV